ncbi:hypothetical protein AAVH_04400 [Aphelenchoides avenae]|nr:hypothetical protein AAVH_04400 [Aphelenchus avenae]
MGAFVVFLLLAVVGVAVWAALNREQAEALVKAYIPTGGASCSSSSRPTSGVNTARGSSVRTAVE